MGTYEHKRVDPGHSKRTINERMNSSASPFGMQPSTNLLKSRSSQRISLQSSGTQPFTATPEYRRGSRAAAAMPFSRDLAQERRARLTANDTHRGYLASGDRTHPSRRDRLVDIWGLADIKVGQTVDISLRSRRFDPVLELVDRQSNRLLMQNDDRLPGDRNSHLSFVIEKGMRYQVQVTSFDTDARGRYALKVDVGEGKQSIFDFEAGYGFINAAAAVAAAIKKSPFSNLPNTSDLWGLDAISAPEVWAQGITGEGVTVAVLDTGVNYRHKDLKDNIWVNADEVAGNGIDDDRNGYIDDVRGWKFVDDDTNDPDDLDSHGTHVAGTIAGVKNGFGVTGVAHGAKIMPVRVIDGADDRSTQKFDQNLADGIRYAVDNGARVLNLSLGAFIDEATLTATRRALRYAYNAGAIAVMAAGNYGNLSNAPIEPALFAKDNLGIAVGASNKSQEIAYFSNPAGNNPLPFIVGPGVGVKSTVLQDGYASYDGTSMATPHVAGVVALMLSANPNLTPDQVRKILIETASLDLFR